MSSPITSPRSRRRSLCTSSSPSSSPRLDSIDPSHPYRFSSLRNSRPLSSSFRGSIYEANSRPRTLSKTSRKSKDAGSPEISNRMSFIDFGDDSSTGLLGSLKGRMHRKRSAPLLNSSYFSSSVAPDEQPANVKPSPPRVRFSFRSQDDTFHSLLDGPNQLFSFRNERKLTAMPEEIVDGVGYGLRESRKSSLVESEPGDNVASASSKFHTLPFRQKDCETLHPYPRTDAPYMQSYNKVDLQNDLYFHHLLRRLNTTGSPSFREYSSPPEHVLDLGCGQGTWAQEAATAWAARSEVVGVDLMDLVSDIPKQSPSVTWKRGNFVAYRLPFKSASFDLVRLSNLTGSVPQDRWEHVLIEVKRVLRPFGRVEIIDDEIIFPYPDLAPKSSEVASPLQSKPHTVRTSWASDQSQSTKETSDASSNQENDSSFLDLDSAADRRSVDSAPGLCREDSPSEESVDYLFTPTGVAGFGSLVNHHPFPPVHNSETPSALLCREIEKIFTSTLKSVYHINTRPSEFLEELLRKVFGPAGKVSILRDFQLSLLRPEMHDLVATTKGMDFSQDSVRRSKKLFKADRDGKKFDRNKELLDKVIVSQSKSKALRVLGADGGTPGPICDPVSTQMSDDSEFTEDSTLFQTETRPRASSGLSTLNVPTSTRPSSFSSQARSHYMPTGLFIFPDQFLETTPSELERYLCKHIDTLLNCKVALDEHVLSLRDENGDAIVSEEEWHDMLWEYERSRRERFTLPDAGGQFDDFDDDDGDSANLLKEPVRHPRALVQQVAMAINNQSHPRHPTAQSSDPNSSSSSSTLVRRIRIFEAYKIKPSLPP